jgi:chlorophyll/bacteriochlorophyll a synthase
MGVRTLPVQLGPRGAAVWTAFSMLGAQLAVIALLLTWDKDWQAAAVTLLSAGQAVLLLRFIGDPVARAFGVSAFGVLMYVTGMMVTATALSALVMG